MTESATVCVSQPESTSESASHYSISVLSSDTTTTKVIFHCQWRRHHVLTFSITVPQEIQQPIHLLTVVYQHGDNKVSGVHCQQFLSHQPCQAGQGISKKINFKYLKCCKP